MKTRSQTRNEAALKVNLKPQLAPTQLTAKPVLLPYEPIDFDEASLAWRANKKHLGNGQFKYVCPVVKDFLRCGRNVLKGCMTCRLHS
jgi:hypothetical protein